MTNPAVRSGVRIERVFSAAICAEIGYRLRAELSGESDPLPQHMTMLVEQMAQTDRVSAGLADKALATRALATKARPPQIAHNS
jgi:hypothetical protein